MLVDLPATGLPVVRRMAGQAVPRDIISPAACGEPDTVRLLTRSATAATLPQNLGVPGLHLTQVEPAGLGNAARASPAARSTPTSSACCLPPTAARTCKP